MYSLNNNSNYFPLNQSSTPPVQNTNRMTLCSFPNLDRMWATNSNTVIEHMDNIVRNKLVHKGQDKPKLVILRKVAQNKKQYNSNFDKNINIPFRTISSSILSQTTTVPTTRIPTTTLASITKKSTTTQVPTTTLASITTNKPTTTLAAATTTRAATTRAPTTRAPTTTRAATTRAPTTTQAVQITTKAPTN